MKIKLLLVLIITIYSSISLAGDAAVYSLKTSRGGFCSATLIKIEGSCKLITNAHCVQDKGEKLILNATNGFMSDFSTVRADLQELKPQGKDEFSTEKLSTSHARWTAEREYFGKESGEIAVEVNTFNRSKDLALLDYPTTLEKTCMHLPNQSAEISNNNQAVRIVGHSKDSKSQDITPKVFYPQNTVISGSKVVPSPSELERHPSHLYEGKEVLHIKGIKSLGGTSGGATFGNNGAFLGITTGIFPGKDTAIVIPKNEVLLYAKNPDFNNKKRFKKHALMETDGGSGTNTDGGSGTNTDGGSGTNTDGGSGTNTDDGGSGTDTNLFLELGGGSGTNTDGGSGTNTDDGGSGTDTSYNPCEPAKDMKMFIAVEEGFFNDIGKIVLAVGGHQIDHEGDLRDFTTGEKITRDKLGFLPLEKRKEIFKRLSGDYNFSEATHKRYSKNPVKVMGWDEKAIGDTDIQIKLSNSELVIKTDDHIMLPTSTVFLPSGEVQSIAPRSRKFKVTHSKDYKYIHLVGNDESMVCKNNSYLRLICSNKNENFSISLSSEKGGESHFRYSKRRKGDAQNPDMVDYFYGRN